MRSVLNELNDSGFRTVQIGNTIYVDVRDWIPFDEEVDKVMEVLTYEMEHAAKLKVALLVSANSAKDWFSVK